MSEKVKEEVVGSDVKFVTFTLALGPGAPQGAVALGEAEQAFKERYTGYDVAVAQVVSSNEAAVQLFFMLVKE